MKRTAVLFLVLGVISLACVWTASPGGGYPTDTPARFIPSTEENPTSSPQLCAVVTADEALHLRGAPGERALVVTWLLSGDVVHVVDQINGDWWRVRFEGFEGYARAAYLEESACAEDGAKHDHK